MTKLLSQYLYYLSFLRIRQEKNAFASDRLPFNAAWRPSDFKGFSSAAQKQIATDMYAIDDTFRASDMI